MIDILLLGATGYTGRLIARYLATHPQRHAFTFALAARSDSKLKALVHEYQEYLADVPTFVVDITENEDLDRVVERARVVINTVGPYWCWGTPVVRACVRHGRHYVDLAGEAHWIKDVIFEFDYAATQSGSVIVPCAGLDSVPSDILAYLGNKTLKAFAGPSATVDMSTSAWKLRGVRISGGTFSTILTYLETVPDEKAKAAMMNFALSPIRGTPSPRPRAFYSLPLSNPPIQGTLYPMAMVNLQVVQRSWGLPGGEHEDTSELPYGSQFKYEEFLALPSRLYSLFDGAVLHLVSSLPLMFYGLSEVRWLARKIMPKPGEGLADDITNITKSVPNAQGRTTSIRTIFRGKGEPGYLITSIMIAECALSLVLDADSLPAFSKRGGVLTPMTAFGDVLIERLKACGRIGIESEVIVAASGRTKAL
ncbi:Saccharopine dehydrogenase-domain-containing protein [Melanogaster broomeanus]|nr:Saccharopine dehydrogenase-domain-containing protein [Melanogaster broomeanus]